MRECKHIVLSIGVRSLFRKIAGDAKVQCETLWRHGALTANLCRQLNRKYRLALDGQEYAAGLLHDIGRMLVLLADPRCFALAGGLDFREEPGLLDRECAAIGIDHAALGGWFGEHSLLPDALIQTVRWHHDPDHAQASPNGRLVALVAAADHIANHLQGANGTETYDLEKNTGLAYVMAGWSQNKRERLGDELPGLIQEAVTATDEGG